MDFLFLFRKIPKCVPILAFSGSIICNHISYCQTDQNTEKDEEKIKKSSSCADYNSMYWKLNSSRRRQKCKQQLECYFDEDGLGGNCKQLSELDPEAITSSSTSTTKTHQIYSLLVKKDSEDIVVAIEGLMKETFTSSVADSIEKSHEAAHEVAKALVLDVLQNVTNTQHVGTILSHIFVDETVLSSTRALAYFYLHTDPTMESIMHQLNLLRFYYCRGGGKVYSEIELINEFLVWSQTQQFREVVYPILIQTLQDHEHVIEPLGHISAESLLSVQESSSKGLASIVANQLQAESSKEYAKTFISQLLKKRSREKDHDEQVKVKDQDELPEINNEILK